MQRFLQIVPPSLAECEDTDLFTFSYPELMGTNDEVRIKVWNKIYYFYRCRYITKNQKNELLQSIHKKTKNGWLVTPNALRKRLYAAWKFLYLRSPLYRRVLQVLRTAERSGYRSATAVIDQITNTVHTQQELSNVMQKYAQFRQIR